MRNFSSVRTVGLFLVGWMLASEAGAVKSGFDFNKYKEKYPDKKLVTLEQHYAIDIKLDKFGEPYYELEYSKDDLILDNLEGFRAKKSFQFSEWKMKDLEMNAWSEVPLKSKFKKIPVKSFNKTDENGQNIFHDDLFAMNYTVPSVSVGTINHEEYSYKMMDGHFLGSKLLAAYEPCELLTIQVTYPDQITLDQTVLGLSSNEYILEKSKSGNTNKVIYKRKSIEELDFEPDGPSPLYYIPRLLMRITYVEKKGNRKPYLASVDDLHTYYQGFLDSLNIRPNKKIKTLVDSLTIDDETQFEKANSIFKWVQQNIKYIAFEEGVQGFIPEQASIVCDSRFGDCKGISSLIVEMMKMANIDSYYTWIGTRRLPYKYTEHPSPITDNHMIATIKIDDKYYFLDGTDSKLSFGIPSRFIQGKQALISVNKDEFLVKEVPTLGVKDNLFIDSVNLYFDNDMLKGKGRAVLTGYRAVELRHYLSFKNQDETKKYLDYYLEKGSNKFKLTRFKVENLDNLDSSLIVHYEFDLEDYVRTINNKKYINLNLDKWTDEKLKDDRTIPYEVQNQLNWRMIVSLELPENYVLNYVPENDKYENDLFGFNTTYKMTNKSVIHTANTHYSFLVLEKENFEAFNNFNGQLKKSIKKSLVLKLNDK